MNLLGIDFGTTSVKSVMFDKKFNELTSTLQDYTLKTHGDRVEFEAEKYFELLVNAIKEAKAKA